MGNTSLPFSVTLDDFRLQRYPGSHSPMSYESDLVIKKGDEAPVQATVRMNKVIDIDGYRLFQSSFDPDEQGTILSVSYDRPGMQLTYIGYFLLFAGFVLTLFSKKSRFGRLRRELGEMKKNMPYCVLFLLALSGVAGGQTVHAQQPCVSSQHAGKFGSLVVLNPNGRLEPVNSYTSAILRKLYGADKLNGINSDQFFLNLLSFPDEWGAYPFIKVDNKELLQRFGRSGKYICLL